MTRYNGLEPSAVKQVVHDRVELERATGAYYQIDLKYDLDGHLSSITIPGTSSEDSLDEALEDARGEIEELIEDVDPHGSQDDQIEGVASAKLYEAVTRNNVPIEVLDNRKFWAHISIAYLWNFVIWRQRSTFDRLVAPETLTVSARGSSDGQSPVDSIVRNFLDYVDGGRSSECIASRLFLRIHCLGGSEHSTLGSKVTQGTDFWRSHVLRVKQGSYPGIVRAMVRRQADPSTRLTTTPLRAFARNLNHHLYNFEPDVLNPGEQDSLVGALWDEQLSGPVATPAR